MSSSSVFVTASKMPSTTSPNSGSFSMRGKTAQDGSSAYGARMSHSIIYSLATPRAPVQEAHNQPAERDSVLEIEPAKVPLRRGAIDS